MIARRFALSRTSAAVLALVAAWATSPHYSNAHVLAAGVRADDVSSARDLLDTYCVSCHNHTLKTAGLELDRLDASRVGGSSDVWEKVVTKLRTAEMPPPGRPRPDAATYRAVADALEHRLETAAAANPHPGRVPVHRLNRAEYANAIRDLLGLDIDARSL